MFKVDDILAALLMCLAAFRRLEAKSTEPPPDCELQRFKAWQARAVSAYSALSLASAGKVVLSVGWFALAVSFEIGAPWLHVGGLLVFISWVLVAVWSWKRITDARHERVQLGIRLGRRKRDKGAVRSSTSRSDPALEASPR